ncbi:MAG: peptidyl-prolyl cis-trans isomerase [Campylobacterales bacterium]|nr:peptidyl-prolyl cis-trans isomerase [Campylobacterales bacterium]
MYKLFLSLLCAASLSAEMVGGVAIVVKGNEITLLDIKKEMMASKVEAKMASDILIRKKLELAETTERNINVSNEEVYEDIKKTASRNNLSISQFYEAVRNSNGLTSEEIKDNVKSKLLSQKLYSAISLAQMAQPSDSEIEEYYKLHKDSFVHPTSFSVVIYESKDKDKLNQKIENPMFNSSDIQSGEQTLPYEGLAPELASLLEKTEENKFTQVISDAKGGYICFYMKKMVYNKESSLDSIKEQIANHLMGQKREQVLSDYFARLRIGADIKILRMPE